MKLSTVNPGGVINGGRNQAVKQALMNGRLDTALAVLNMGTRFRFTAAFALDGDLLHNRGLVDKLGEPTPDVFHRIRLEDSFCQFVKRDGFFQTSDSASDKRLAGYPFQGIVMAYIAAPITDSTGQWMIGSLCHFDFVRQQAPQHESDLLRRAARLVSARMLAEPMPA